MLLQLEFELSPRFADLLETRRDSGSMTCEHFIKLLHIVVDLSTAGISQLVEFR